MTGCFRVPSRWSATIPLPDSAARRAVIAEAIDQQSEDEKISVKNLAIQLAEALKSSAAPNPTGDTHIGQNLILIPQVTHEVHVHPPIHPFQPSVLQPPTKQPTLGLHGIPAPPLKFVGRKEKKEEILDAVRVKGVRVLALKGLGGVGKTALALKLAQELKIEYPDAQFYFDLKGESSLPLEPKQIMQMVASAFREDRQAFASQEYERLVYLDALHNQRAILIMDNARNSEQVRHLRPNSNCLMLVTSRWPVDIANQYELNELSRDESIDLLYAIAPRLQREERIAEVADICGYLPIALNAVGRVLEKNRNLSVSDYLLRIRQAKDRVLKEIDPELQRSTAAVFQTSYDLLSSDLRELFRFLSVFPSSFDQGAAGAIWAAGSERTQPSLNELDSYSLVGFDSDTNRYRLHDLVRVFAATLNSSSESVIVGQRHSEYFLLRLKQAESEYVSGMEEQRIRAIETLNTEWTNIQAGQEWAAKHVTDSSTAADLCWRYPFDARNCLRVRLTWKDRIPWLQAALQGAKRLDNLEWESRALASLGAAYMNSGDPFQAIAYSKQHLDFARKHHELQWENIALYGLGMAYEFVGDCNKAIAFFTRRVELSRRLGSRGDEGAAYGGLGDTYYQLGDFEVARDFFQKRLDIERTLPGTNKVGCGHALHGLGRALNRLHRFDEALRCHREHLELSDELSDPLGKHSATGGLGEVLYSLGDYDGALDKHLSRIDVAEQMEDRLGAARGYFGGSLALYALGRHAKATEAATKALRIFEDVKSWQVMEVQKQLIFVAVGENGDLGYARVLQGCHQACGQSTILEYSRSDRTRWRREPYANIHEPTSVQLSLQRPKESRGQVKQHHHYPLILRRFGDSVGSPEKAGVGGSTPSLAAMFSTT